MLDFGRCGQGDPDRGLPMKSYILMLLVSMIMGLTYKAKSGRPSSAEHAYPIPAVARFNRRAAAGLHP
jgi:hypothetical protein